MKKFGGFIKYWWSMYRCVGFFGIVLMGIWPKSSTTDYEKIWEMKND